MKAANLTPTEMAKKAEISRSQVYYLTGSKSLPRKPDQLARFLSTCRLHPEQVKFVLNQWARLDERRGEPPIVPELVSDQAPGLSGADADAVSPTSAKAMTPEDQAGTVRRDGLDGQSAGVIGSSGDVDREQLAKLLMTFTSYESMAAKTFRYGIVGVVVLMAILSLLSLLSLGSGSVGSGSLLAAQSLLLIISTGGLLLLLVKQLFGSMESMIARFSRWRVRRFAVDAQAKAATPEEVDAKRPDDSRPDIRLVA